MTPPWAGTLMHILVMLLVALVLGAIFNHISLAIALTLALCLAQQLRQAYRFSRWLEHHDLAQTPASEHNDMWAQLYRQVYQIKRRSQRRKRRLADLLERYQKSAAALPDVAVALRSDFSIIWFNKAASHWLGLHRRDLGQRIDNLVRYPAFIHYLRAELYDDPLELMLPGHAEQVLSIQIIPYGGDLYLMLARDISQIHRMETMRRDFVANASHELRTPLTVFSGYLEALVDRFQDDPTLGHVFIQMQHQASRMNQLIHDLLKISRLEILETGSHQDAVNIPAMMKRILSETRALSQGAHRIEQETLDPDIWLLGVEKDLFSAFSNLLSNAVQYTPKGGKVSASWKKVEQGCEFSVRDTGIGIPPQLIPRLTERFYRVDPGRSSAVGGTGLGLSIVKHVLRLHDGELLIESVPGEGSQFTCHFPEYRMAKPKHVHALEVDKGGC